MFSALSQAWRSWKAAKGVAALAVLAFAVGTGSATAIYTVVNGIILKPLPYEDAGRFVAIYGASISEPDRRSSLSIPELLEYQQRTHSFDVFGWFKPVSFNLVFNGQPQHVDGAAVTISLARNLGVNPLVGQWFADDHGAVIASSLWRRLGGDPKIVGTLLLLDGRPFTVTGVMPSPFRLPLPGSGDYNVQAEVWIALDPLGTGQDLKEGAYFSYARLKPGVALVAARSDVTHAAAEIAALDPVSHPSYTARVDDLRETVIEDIRPTLVLLMAAAGLLELITCADVAGLLLARSAARARETAIRVALGAGRRQLALHYFMEGLAVSVAGAAAGVGVSMLLVRGVLSLAAEDLPRADEIALDWRVLLFTLGTACAASLLVSLLPLWQAVRTVPADVLSEGVRASASAQTRRLSRALVVAEIALAFTLLSVSAILIGHLRALRHTSPGFDPDNLLTFRLTTQRPQDHAAARQQYQDRFLSALLGTPGISDAAVTNQLPLDGCCFSTTIYAEGRPEDRDTVERTSFVAVSPGYLRAMRIPLLAGRFLTEADVSAADKELLHVVVNEAAVRSHWPGHAPLGAFGHVGSPDGTRFEVVGIVGDVRNNSLAENTVPEIYLPAAETASNPLRFVVRSSLPPATLVADARQAVQRVDPTLPIHDVAMMRDIVSASLSHERVGSFMLAFFAIAALLLATLGVYGVVSYSVRQGTVEIGTRMALGAIGRDILRRIVGSGLRMVLYGLALGGVAVTAAAWALTRWFEIRQPGVMPWLSSSAIVALVAAAASFFPAWRATRLSPLVALRNEPGSAWRSARQMVRQRMAALSRAVSLAGDPPAADDLELLTGFVAAARGAASFSEAFTVGLATLCDRIGASSAILLEQAAGGYRAIATRSQRAPEQPARVCVGEFEGQSPSNNVGAPEDPTEGWTLPARGFLLGRLTFYSYPLPLSSGDLESHLRWSRDQRPGQVAEIEGLAARGVRMAIPLRTRTEILGVLLLGPPTGRDAYTAAQTRLLRYAGQELTLMIENARLMGRVVEQDKLRRDLELGALVQRRLLPQAPPEARLVALAAVSIPARSVGGDYYDFLDLGEERIGIALADIAGKGIPAALIMTVVQASLRSVVAVGSLSPSEIAGRINGFLHRSTGSNSYATFFYAELDQRTRQLRYVNAGHNPPHLIRANSGSAAWDSAGAPDLAIEELAIGGTVVGLFPDVSYDEGTVDLRSGDVLVVFTDGVTEALNASEEEFGDTRLKDLLRGIAPLPAVDISSRISEALERWILGTAQYDDMTYVVLKVK